MKLLLITLCAFVCIRSQGEQLASVSVALASAPTAPFVRFVYNGDYYSPARPLVKGAGEIDRSSPQALARSLFTAYNEQNLSLYAAVYGQSAAKSGYQPSPINCVSRMAVVSEMRYGALTILLLEMETPSATWTEPLYFTQTNGYYYMSQPSPDRALRLLETYFSAGWKGTLLYGGTPHYESSPAFGILTTNALADSRTNRLVIEFRGKTFIPPLVLSSAPAQSEPHSTDQLENLHSHQSPEQLFQGAVTCLRTRDADRYLDLIDPDALPRTADATGARTLETYVRATLKDMASCPEGGFALTQKVECGESQILFYKWEKAQRAALSGWLLCQNKSQQWYLENTHNNRNFPSCYPILRYFDFPLPAYANIFLYCR